MSSVPRYGSDVPPGGLVDALDRAGCLVVTGMFDHEMHESVKGELASHMAAAAVADDPARALPDRGATVREPDPRGFYPGHTRPTGSLVARSPTVRRLVLDPTAQAMCDHFLTPTSEFGSHLHVTAALNLGSGARAQILHREEDSYSSFPLPKPNLIVAKMWAVTDFRADNGATLLVPEAIAGSRSGDPPIRKSVRRRCRRARSSSGSAGRCTARAPTPQATGATASSSRIRLAGCGKKRTNTSIRPPQVADRLAPGLGPMVGYKMHRALGSCVGADQARRPKP